MGQSKPFRATALVVEDDPMQREMICLLLEESEVDVIECEARRRRRPFWSAPAAASP